MSDDQSHNAPRFSTVPAPGSHDAPPPSAQVEVDFGACSHRGPHRPVNDDHYLILRLGRLEEVLRTSLPEGEVPDRFNEYGYGMVVADGIGGAGETASRLAISTLVHLAIYFGKFHVRVDEPIAEEMMDRARRFYRSVDSLLVEASQYSPHTLQTTMTAVYTVGTELFFAHVGHSRAYVFRDDQLMQLTHDHTIDRARPRKTIFADESTNAHDLQQLLTPSLGAGRPGVPKIDIERCGLLDGDTVLLCTNGLSDTAEDTQIANVLRRPGSSDDQCRALVELAANSGAKDDVTAIVAHYRIRE